MGLFGTLKGIIESLGYGSDVDAFLVVFGLAFVRIAITVSLSPFLGGNTASNPVKTGLAMMLTLLLMPGLKAGAPEGDVSPLLFFALLLKEVTIGLTIGILSQLIFYAVQMAGALVDTARGMDQPGLLTPQLQSNVSVLAQLKFQMALVLFLTLNGHLIYIRSLAMSFEQIPLRGFVRFETVTGAERAAALSGQVFLVALQLAAPVLVALFLIDICFAALAKVAPQMNVYTESQPVKSLVGLAVLLLAVGLIVTRLQGVLSGFLWEVYRLVAGLGSRV
jgi:flagellar biosynthesis protein FliR